MTAFINEIHYDNTGTDEKEFIEIAGPAGLDLSGWSITLYNGATRVEYNTLTLTEILSDEANGFGFTVVNLPTNGLQNGSPDGITLVDDVGDIIQFLSYEGVFTASGGPADGLMSMDIGVSEPSNTPVGSSLQLMGKGSMYSDFMWTGPISATKGAVNTGQGFIAADQMDVPLPATSLLLMIALTMFGVFRAAWKR